MRVRELRLPCADKECAEAFAAWLRNQQLGTVTVDGRHVSVPTNSHSFAWEVAEIANERGWAHDDEVIRAVYEFLEERS